MHRSALLFDFTEIVLKREREIFRFVTILFDSNLLKNTVAGSKCRCSAINRSLTKS